MEVDQTALLFNAHASALWARCTTYLRREIATRLGMIQKTAHAVLRISFGTVAEYRTAPA
ncbi:replication initiator [Streptomyces sp. NBC_00562]|uniref:replication initiator n=1 Tax=Streptomyces sp. NBC_00562 TaxID=2975777 RepID=UPI003FCD654A